MNFEMFASKKLLSTYAETYLSKIMQIQSKRENRTLSKIQSISKHFESLLDIVHAHMVYCEKTSEEVFEKMTFDKLIKMLNEYLYEHPFSEEELNHIFFNGEKYGTTPYLDIAIKRLLFSLYSTQNIQQIIDEFEKEKEYCTGSMITYQPFIQLLNKKFESKSDIISYLYKKFEKWFNHEFNCGGYALEIFDWVLCNDTDNDITVTRILTNPSVRLLGDTLLQDDEYLVILDATGYHFIKHKDGRFFEKMRHLPYW